jgi:hypothetical protein
MVLFQPSSYLARLDSDDWIVSCRIANGTLEKFCSYRAFFQRFVVAFQGVLDHVSQKLLTPITGAKERAAQDGFQFPKYSLFLRAVYRRAVMNLWVSVGECRRIHRTHCSAGKSA